MADKLIVGCGYLGRRVAARWRAEGHRVFGTTRSEGKAEELAKLGVEPVVCDVLEPESWKRLPAAPTVLYCVGFDRGAGKSMRDVYVEGVRHFRGYWTNLPDRIVYISSTSVYGQSQGEEVDETSPTEPQEESGKIILEAEQMLCGGWFDRIQVLRLAGIYGPARIIRHKDIQSGVPIIGDPDKWLNLIHVEDAAAAVVAADRGETRVQVYNVSDNCPVRRRDFYTEMARLLGAPEPRFVPPEPGMPLPNHERANRRILNRRMREELGVTLRFPSYRDGLPAALSLR